MYQFALIKMLHNEKDKTYHPIFYYDSPLPGPMDSEANTKIMRYKSKGHHTEGFDTRDKAVTYANELKTRMETEFHDTVQIEIDEADDLIWNGEGIPGDVLIRLFPTPPAPVTDK